MPGDLTRSGPYGPVFHVSTGCFGTIVVDANHEKIAQKLTVVKIKKRTPFQLEQNRVL